MSASLRLSGRARLLICAPHPDDETLAAGELIQSALATGASVRVIFATDGENNPWPQRLLDRRWRIGPAQRVQWAARRRGEAISALAILGVTGAESVRFLEWPDQGLTNLLMRNAGAVTRLTQEISSYEPTHLVMPMLADRHPDHSALRVMLELALLRAGHECMRLGYAVHGQQQPEPGVVVETDASRKIRKYQALAEHSSQMALSGRRLSRMAERPEMFETVVAATSPPGNQVSTTARMPYRAHWPALRRRDLLVVLATATRTFRYRCGFPQRLRDDAAMSLVDAEGKVLSAICEDDVLTIRLPARDEPVLALYVKVHRPGPRFMIFDRERWHDALQSSRAPSTVIDRRTAPEIS